MSTPVTMPSNTGFKDSRFGIMRKTSVTQSPFSGAPQVYSHPFALWNGTYTLPPMKREKASEWIAFMMKLKGREGTFYAYDPDAKEPQGKVTTSVTLNGAIAVGDTSIDVDCSNNNLTDAFKAGDYIQIGTGSNARLYMITDDANTNSTGGATLEIQPPVKKASASGSTVVVDNPVGVFRMDSDDLGWDANHVSVFGISFSFTEVV